MKKNALLVTTMVGASLIIAGCGDSTDEETDSSVQAEDEEMETSDDEVEDQMDLRIGDTALLDSNISTFAFTLHSVEIVEEEDEFSDIDGIIIADITIKNVGDEPIDALENSRLFEYTDFLEGSGMRDYSEEYDQYESIEGELEPGDEVTGKAVYPGFIDNENYIRVKPGTAGTGLVNDAVFTFTLDETE